jgi:hypothetical protein
MVAIELALPPIEFTFLQPMMPAEFPEQQFAENRGTLPYIIHIRHLFYAEHV